MSDPSSPTDFSLLPDPVRRFLADQRVAHLATANKRAIPHVVPVCFVTARGTLYVTIDDKPKRQPPAQLTRLRNIAQNPNVCVVVDRYAEDWRLLGWVMLHGTADVLADGSEHDDAQSRLRSKYPQLRPMTIERHPVIALRILRWTSWGNLYVPGGD
jgi:PPOX class probable F420-dependent enzyme